MYEREYTTRRLDIATGLVEVLKTIDGTGENRSNLWQNVATKLKFWDEISDFPAVYVTAGSETRDYQAGGYRDRYLRVTLRCYVNEEDAATALSYLIEDIETVLELNSKLKYIDRFGNTQYTHQITINSITTDEGVLEPYGIGEIDITVRY